MKSAGYFQWNISQTNSKAGMNIWFVLTEQCTVPHSHMEDRRGQGDKTDRLLEFDDGKGGTVKKYFSKIRKQVSAETKVAKYLPQFGVTVRLAFLAAWVF